MEILNFSYSEMNILNGSNSSSLKATALITLCVHMPAMKYFYLSLQVINLCFGAPANMTVLWLLHKNKKDSSTSDIFIMQLAILDTFFCLLPPVEMTNILYMDSTTIEAVLRFFYGLKDSTALFLSVICLDRYMAVAHPITFSTLKDRPHRPVCAVVLWLITLPYAASKCTIPDFKYDKIFMILTLTAFTIMLFCNVSILRALRRSGPGKDEMHPVKKRAFKMVLIILAIIIFNYLPPVVILPFQEYFVYDVFICKVRYTVFGFMDISSSIQPVLYLSKENLSCAPIFCCIGRGTEEVHSAQPPV